MNINGLPDSIKERDFW